MKLHNRVLISLAAGAIVGVVGHHFGSPTVTVAFTWMGGYGRIFIRLISMIVIPLVIASMVVGIASLGDLRTLGRIGGKTLALFFLTTLASATIAVPVALLIHPGNRLQSSGAMAMPASPQAGPSAAPPATSLPDAIVDIIPTNLFAAASSGDLFGVIVFTLIFGAAIGSLPPERRDVLVKIFRSINDASMKVIDWTMKLAPTAVFCLIASVIGRFGVDILRGLALFCVTVLAGLLVQLVVVYGLILIAGCRWSPLRFYLAIAEVALMAFSTSSSSATLPVSMKTAEEELSIPTSIAAFVLPLGSTMNKNGSALYKSAAVIFIAQAAGMTLGLPLLTRIIFAATLSAMTTAGVPGSGLVAIVVVLQASGLGALAPVGSVLVAGVDRILDMVRTTVNVVGNMVCLGYVARSEGTGSLPEQRSLRVDFKFETAEKDSSATCQHAIVTENDKQTF
jgi:Na+/H+-dicarboxylate symporter